MDINLTGPIAANVALSQSWYALGIIALAGPLSAIIAAAAVYYTTKWSEKRKQSTELENERRRVYALLIADIMDIRSHNNNNNNNIDRSRVMRDVSKVLLVADTEIFDLINKIIVKALEGNDPIDKLDVIAKDFYEQILPVMRRKLDVEPTKSRWLFWK
ncbi:MAG: hypothetical protein MUE87_00180 [Methanothrix sp.]|jgi:hypothetical protein|nr:hypothetical protein [Methanothrix sp.]